MNTASTSNDERYLADHRKLRKDIGRSWAVESLLIVAGGMIGFLVTDNLNWVWGGLFFGAIPIVGWIWTHYFLLRLDTPEAMRERTETLYRRQRRSTRFNGYLLTGSSPIILVLAVGGGAAEYGVGSALAGLIVGVLWLAAGLWGVRWSKRSAVPWV